MLFWVMGLPVAGFLILLIWQYNKINQRLWFGALAVFLLTAALGIWGIQLSRSSTSALGYLFLPSYAAIAGSLFIVGGRCLVSGKKAFKHLAKVFFAVSVIPFFLMLKSSIDTSQSNQQRAEDRTRNELIRAQLRQELKQVLAERSEAEARTELNRLVSERQGERNFLLVSLSHPLVDPQWIKKYIFDKDMGLALTALRNPHCQSEWMAELLLLSNYSDYYLHDMVRHPNVSAEVLALIYSKSQSWPSLQKALATNKKTPQNILLELSQVEDLGVFEAILENTELSCSALPHLRSVFQELRPEQDSAAWTLYNQFEQERCSAF